MSEEIQDNQEAPEAAEVPDKFKNEDGTVNTDAMIKSYTDLEKDRSRAVTEIDGLKKQAEASKSSEVMTETLKVIAENTKPEEEATQSYDEYLTSKAKEYAKEMDLDEDDPAVKYAVKLNAESAKSYSAWMKQDADKMQSEFRKEIDELKASISNDKSAQVKQSADYLAHKAEIEEMVGAGIDEGKAINFVLSKAKDASDISDPPLATVNGRTTSAKATDEYWSSAEERERFVAENGEEETLKLEKAGKARISRTAVEVA